MPFFLYLFKFVRLFFLLWNQSDSVTLFLIRSLFPDDPLFLFFRPLCRCLSEKEIQLECVFDGEIGSVVYVHFSFFCSLRVISLSSSLWLVRLVCFYCLGHSFWGFFSISASASAINTMETISHPDGWHMSKVIGWNEGLGGSCHHWCINEKQRAFKRVENWHLTIVVNICRESEKTLVEITSLWA